MTARPWLGAEVGEWGVETTPPWEEAGIHSNEELSEFEVKGIP